MRPGAIWGRMMANNIKGITAEEYQKRFAKKTTKRTRRTGKSQYFTIPQILKLLGLPDPLIDYRFHPTRRWLIDYAYPKDRFGLRRSIAIEYEGAPRFDRSGDIQQKSRHFTLTGYSNDCEKYNEIGILHDWHLLRFTVLMCRQDDCIALRQIERCWKNNQLGEI